MVHWVLVRHVGVRRGDESCVSLPSYRTVTLPFSSGESETGTVCVGDSHNLRHLRLDRDSFSSFIWSGTGRIPVGSGVRLIGRVGGRIRFLREPNSPTSRTQDQRWGRGVRRSVGRGVSPRRSSGVTLGGQGSVPRDVWTPFRPGRRSGDPPRLRPGRSGGRRPVRVRCPRIQGWCNLTSGAVTGVGFDETSLFWWNKVRGVYRSSNRRSIGYQG